MKLAEYASYDALGLAALVARKQVSPTELAETAAAAIEAINPAINAVVETYPDRIENLDEGQLGNGPFRGVPFLMKDVFGHEAGRKIEFGSRLCRGMLAQQDTYYCELFRASGAQHPRPLRRARILDGRHDRGRAVRQHLHAVARRLLGRRIDRRRDGRGDRRYRAHRARFRHRWLDPHSRELLRRRRTQAVSRTHLVRPDGRRKRLRSGAELRAGQERARRRGDARLSRAGSTRRPIPHPEAAGVLFGTHREETGAPEDRLVDHRLDGHGNRRRRSRAQSPTSHASWSAWDTRCPRKARSSTD